MGRKLAELEHDDLREIGVHSWRVLYYVKSPDIHVIAVVHKRQELIGLPRAFVNDMER
jgi:plasmid stabilization system protein ParE